MAKYAEFIIEANITKEDILKFKSDFRTDIIINGLDSIIGISISQLKDSLKYLINEQIRSVTSNTFGVTPAAGQTNELGQPVANPPKSEEEIIKFLTNGKTDISKYNKAKDYTTLQESGIVFGQRSRGMELANRIALRMDIDNYDTVQNQYAKAKQFFQESVFALPDAGGITRYFVNPGLDITSYVKIKCSTLTGDGDAEPFTGMSPAQRFQRDRHTKGYADWTLKQDGVDFIRQNFIDLTDIVERIKDGDFETANKLLSMADKGSKLTSVRKQIDPEETSDTVTTSTRDYFKAIALINNIKLVKKSDDVSSTYILVSSYTDFSTTEVNFLENILVHIRSWIVASEDDWFKELIKKVTNLIRKFETAE